MKIRVEVKSEKLLAHNILGKSIFWEGDAADVNEIKNMAARVIARWVAKDGEERQHGMWFVSVVDEGCNED